MLLPPLPQFTTFIDYLTDNRFRLRLFDDKGLPVGLGESDELYLLIGNPQETALVMLSQTETTNGRVEIVTIGLDGVTPAEIVLHLYMQGTTHLKENNAYQGDLLLLDVLTQRYKQIAKIGFVVQPVVRFPVLPMISAAQELAQDGV